MLALVGMADQADRLTAEIAYGDVKRLDLAHRARAASRACC